MAKTKYIETPERMRELWYLYKANVKSNPILVHDFVGKDGDAVYKEKERPLTMEGFEDYLDTEGVITDVSDYFENKEDRYKEYIPICRVIKRAIRRDHIEGGMAGIYNPSITQRLNNLKEQTENTNINKNINLLNIDPLNDSVNNEPKKDSQP
jgi:hypothetical protein